MNTDTDGTQPTPAPTPSNSKQETGSPGLRKAALVGGAIGLLLVGLLLGRWTSPAVPAASPGTEQAADAEPTVWTCSMHPQIQSPNPGKCPLCGMDLIPASRGGDDTAPRVLKLSPHAAALAEIETEPVRRREVDREIRMVGKVDYDETRLNYITAWVPGRLDRLFVDYTGTVVRKGDHLVEVYSPQLLSAQQELIQSILARDTLRDGGSRLLRETSEQTVESSREKLRLWGLGPDQIEEIERTKQTSDHITIRAPIGGIVVHKNKNTGEYVKTGERVYTIADLSRVWVKLDAYESDLAWVRYGQTVSFEVESYPGLPFEGLVVFVDPVLTGNTRTVKVRLNVDNREGRLKPGMFVRAVLRASLQSEGQTMDPSLNGKWICPMHGEEIEDAEGACDQCGMPLVRAETLHRTRDPSRPSPLTVPATAVLWTGKRSLVYVREPGDDPVFRGQEIVLGPRAGDFYVVLEGLEEGQLVVTKGAFKIDSSLQLEARPSMMLPDESADPEPRLEVPAAFLAALDPVFDAYLTLQAALAGDDAGAAKAAAESLTSAVRGVDMSLVRGPGHVAWMGLAKRLRDGAEAAAGAKAIDSTRIAFAALSTAVLELEHQFGHREGVLREAFCPMALDNEGASWLQRAEELQNPFYGASMLTCGDIRATLPGQDDSPAHDPPAPERDDARPDDAPTPVQVRPTTRPSPQPTPEQPPTSGAQLDPFRQQFDGVLGVYVALQRELADDKATGGTRAPELQRALEAVEASSVPLGSRAAWSDDTAPALLADIQRLGAAADLKAQREAFDLLSSRLSHIVAEHGHLESRSVRRFHCPMAFGRRGADWLQEDERTLNPYFGSRMLRCGSQVEVLPAAGQPPEGQRVDPPREGGDR